MPIILKRAALYLLIAYSLVTILGFLLTVALYALAQLPPDPPGTPAYAVAP